MPIIIDANRTGDFSRPLNGHAQEILKRLYRNRISVVIGGKLTGELGATKFAAILTELSRAGRLKKMDNATVERETKRVASLALVSDDPHVIALAIISGARLIYTEDKDLKTDLKNGAIIRPRCKVLTAETANRHARNLLDRHSD